LKLSPSIEIDVPLAGKKTFDVPEVSVDIPAVDGTLDLGAAAVDKLGAPPPDDLAGPTGTTGARAAKSPPDTTPPTPPAGRTDAGATDAGATDGSPGLDAGDAGPTFDPKKVPSLALWLSGGLGVTETDSYIARWSDQSGMGNHAHQDDVSKQPILV